MFVSGLRGRLSAPRPADFASDGTQLSETLATPMVTFFFRKVYLTTRREVRKKLVMTMRSRDFLDGRVFGLLTVRCLHGIGPVGTQGRVQSLWVCDCVCGRELVVSRKMLLRGKKRYCSVVNHRDEFARAVSAGAPGHGLSRSDSHRTWARMLSRCGPKGKYRKFGISVCDR